MTIYRVINGSYEIHTPQGLGSRGEYIRACALPIHLSRPHTLPIGDGTCNPLEEIVK